MWVWLAQGAWWVFGGLLSGFKLGLGMFIGQVFTTILLAAAGIYFKDWILDFITFGLDFAINAVNAVGLDLPAVSEIFGMLPVEILQGMKRVDVSSSLTIVTTALVFRGFMGIFNISRAAKAAAAVQ